MVNELGWEGSEGEFGARLWEVLASFGEFHFRCAAGGGELAPGAGAGWQASSGDDV